MEHDGVINEQFMNVRGRLEIKTINNLNNGLLKNECMGSSQREKRNERNNWCANVFY